MVWGIQIPGGLNLSGNEVNTSCIIILLKCRHMHWNQVAGLNYKMAIQNDPEYAYIDL